MGIITSLEVQKRNKQRVSVFVDGEYAFSLTLVEAARLHKGQALDEAEIVALRGADAVQQAVDSAAHFLGFRPRSAAEVRRNLAEKGFAPETVAAALERLMAMGFVDDTAFARFWVESRSAFKPISPKALRVELRQKGVPDEVIQDTLDDLDAGELAYQAAQKQAQRLRGQTHRDFRLKLSLFLQRRGFSYDTTRTAVERVIEELDALDPPFFIQRTESHED